MLCSPPYFIAFISALNSIEGADPQSRLKITRESLALGVLRQAAGELYKKPAASRGQRAWLIQQAAQRQRAGRGGTGGRRRGGQAAGK